MQVTCSLLSVRKVPLVYLFNGHMHSNYTIKQIKILKFIKRSLQNANDTMNKQQSLPRKIRTTLMISFI